MAEALLIGYGCGATFIPKVQKFLKTLLDNVNE